MSSGMSALRTTTVRVGKVLLVYFVAWHVAFMILLVVDGAFDRDLLPVLWHGYVENLRFIFLRPGGESATYQQLLTLALTVIAAPFLVFRGGRRPT
jgi:hypothetical protein